MLEQVASTLARVRVPLGFLCAVAVLWLAEPTWQSLTIGGALAAMGELVRIWAAGHLEKGREVTQSGPYRFMRHPLYAGSALIAMGVAIASNQAAAAALVAIYMILTIGAAIRHEEAGMRAAFGDQYAAYAESRALPLERPFSLNRAIKNKEHKAVAGLIGVGLILAVKVVL